MSIPAVPLLQNEVQILNAKPRKLLIGSGDNVLLLDVADLSDHCPVISLQMLEVWLCQWPSLTSMEHCAPHTRIVHVATCLEREVAGRENRTGSSSLNFFQAVFTRVMVESSQPLAAESMSLR